VRRIEVDVKRDGGRALFRYVIEGELEALRLPAPGLRPLWQHTCCEAFVVRPGSPGFRCQQVGLSQDLLVGRGAHHYPGVEDAG